MQFKQSGNTKGEWVRAWDDDRNLLTQVSNYWEAADPNDYVSRFTYRYDAAGRRTDVVREGAPSRAITSTCGATTIATS